MSNSPHIRWEIEGAVARLWIDRPKRRNALAPETLEQLAEACSFLGNQEQVRVVVLSGEGACFSVGFDLQAMSALFMEAGGVPEDAELRRLATKGAAAVKALCALPSTTIASLHGHVVGGGVLLAAACDLRVCARDTRFRLPEVDLGLPMTWGGAPLLVEKLGRERARDLLLTGRTCGPDELDASGFFSAVVPADERESRVAALVAELVEKPGWALRAMTRQLRPALARDEAAEIDAFVAAIRHPGFLENALGYLERLGRAR